jgi:hypothetical protein
MNQNIILQNTVHKKKDNYQSSYTGKNQHSINEYPKNVSGVPQMLIVNPLYDQTIIKPPKENVTHGRISDTEFILSQDRNDSVYPNISNYVINLKNEYRNVISIFLSNAFIPNSIYTIDTRNNLIYFQETFGTTLIATIESGDYTGSTLATAIQTSLNNAPNSSSTYTVTFDLSSYKLKISSNLTGGEHIFNMLFYGGTELCQDNQLKAIYPARSCGRVIGFPKINTSYFVPGIIDYDATANTLTGTGTNFLTSVVPSSLLYLKGSLIDGYCTVITIHSDTSIGVSAVTPVSGTDQSNTGIDVYLSTYIPLNKVDLNSDSCVLLDIAEIENTNSQNSGRSYAVLPLPITKNEKHNVVSSLNSNTIYKKHFNPPLPKLDRFTIKFKDIDGNLINFNGINHYMEFKIQTMNASGFYEHGATNF